jgi:glucosamine--fructose-6-phosphate aminotransferase (isomerizing)
MCGIVGIISEKPVADRLVEGLRRLEYRGYDSAGIATLNNHVINRRRAEGKLANLAQKVANDPITGNIGIGHTRWATHGDPVERNAHPHATDQVAVVHNGIIENYQALRKEMQGYGSVFQSETDTEVIAHLVTHYLREGLNPEQAAQQGLARLQGAFAVAMIFTDHPDLMIGARRGTPLAIGYGDDEMFLASDSYALAPLTNQVSFLEDGDWVVITKNHVTIYDANHLPVSRRIRQSNVSHALTGKGQYDHFMQKEIFEQPETVADTINSLVHPTTGQITLPPGFTTLAQAQRLILSACGTAFYAGLTSQYWFEKYAKMPVTADIASEFRYRSPALNNQCAAMFISQSGETLDTLEALRLCKRNNMTLGAIVNTIESTIEREAVNVIHTMAGPEIGVASTKAFTTQLTVLACVALSFAQQRKALSETQVGELIQELRQVPHQMAEILKLNDAIKAIAEQIAQARDILYLGRGTSYPIALEGALKMKEISYIHAEGYAAGEMKHGPIALIDKSVPVIVVAPRDEWFEKTASNIKEVQARGGQVLLISDKEGCAHLADACAWTLEMPECSSFVSPLLYALPMQLLAYHTAVLKGTDVDQPRNLAKSVTVE